jgi:uncharacterized protein
MSQPEITHRIASLLLEHPRVCGLILVGVVAGSVATLPFMKIQGGTAPFTDPTSKQRQLLNRVNAQFGSDNLLLIACESDDTFSARTLESIRRVGRDLGALEVRSHGQVSKPVAEVTSLTTIRDLIGSELNFKTVPLVPDPVPSDPAQLRRIRERALRMPILRENMLSADLRVSAITVRLVDNVDDDVSAQVVRFARTRLQAEARAHPGLRFHSTGSVALKHDTAKYVADDLGIFIPVVYLLVTILLYVFLRRVLGVVVVFVNITICVLAGSAVLTLVGGTVNNLSAMMPPVVMVLAVATVMHFLAELSKHSRTAAPPEAFHATLHELVGPISMCALTTAVGFASLSASNMPAYRDFGIAAGITVLVSSAVSFLFISAVSRRLRPDQLVAPTGVLTSERFDWILDRYTAFASRHARKLVAGSVALFVVASGGAVWLRVDMNDIEQFHRRTKARQEAAFFQRTLGGTNVMLVSVEGPAADHFLEPDALRRVEALGEFLRRDVGAENVMSVADFVKLMHRAFLDEDEKAYRIPDTRPQVAQLMLLASDPLLGDVVDPANRWVRVVARFKDHSSANGIRLCDRVDAYLAQQFPPSAGYRAVTTGNPRIWGETVDSIVASQTNSFGLSCLLIFGPIFILFRSVRTGLFSIPSNLFPIGITFGLMGWLGINLDMSTAPVAAITLGIAVDDTVHFLAYLRMRLRVHGDVELAMRETMHMKGIGALWTCLVLTIGFSVTILSSFGPTRGFGVLAGISIVTGVIGEFALLPPLILMTRSRLGVKPPPPAAADGAGEGAPAAPATTLAP